MIRTLHHVGIAVADLESAVGFYRDTFGLSAQVLPAPVGSLLRFAIIRLPGTEIELLASTTEETAIAKFLTKRGPGIHHLAFSVDNIVAAMAATASAGVSPLEAHPAPGIEGTLTCFFHPKATHGVLVEYVQLPARESGL